MNECLVTKLKTSVDIEDPSVLGAFKLNVESGYGERTFSVAYNNAGTLRVKSFNGKFKINGTLLDEYYFIATESNKKLELTTLDDNYDIFIDGVYDIQSVSSLFAENVKFDISQLNNSRIYGIVLKSPHKVYGKLDLKDVSILRNLNLGTNSQPCIIADIGQFKNAINLSNFQCYNQRYITGDILQLANCHKLPSTNIGYSGITPFAAEDLAAAMVAAGRPDGTFILYHKGLASVNGIYNLGTITITFDSSLENGYSIAQEAG